MTRQGLDRFPPGIDAGRRWSLLHRTGRDRMELQGPPLVGDADRPIHPVFDHHLRRPHLIVYLIELPLVRHGPIAA